MADTNKLAPTSTSDDALRVVPNINVNQEEVDVNEIKRDITSGHDSIESISASDDNSKGSIDESVNRFKGNDEKKFSLGIDFNKIDYDKKVTVSNLGDSKYYFDKSKKLVFSNIRDATRKNVNDVFGENVKYSLGLRRILKKAFSNSYDNDRLKSFSEQLSEYKKEFNIDDVRGSIGKEYLISENSHGLEFAGIDKKISLITTGINMYTLLNNHSEVQSNIIDNIHKCLSSSPITFDGTGNNKIISYLFLTKMIVMEIQLLLQSNHLQIDQHLK